MDRHDDNKHRRSGVPILLLCLAFCSTRAIAAGVEVDGATPTTLDAAANGVPIVNIADPNARGLSHNTYNRFDVGREGLILNNADRTAVQTQLGGYIVGNPNLNAPARVILNEVTSTHPSALNGYTEVAGQGADVVIANPNGISVNGAGFLNAPRVTLTTGVPEIDPLGNLGGFDVRGGEIAIGGDGLDTSRQSATSIYTHFLQLNAKLHARDLDIALGRNRIDYPGRRIVRSQSSGGGRVLLDSSALGGIYANKIVLVGTDRGLGMNLPPEAIASSGEIRVSNDGRIVLQQLDAADTIVVQSSDTVSTNASVYSRAAVEIDAPEVLVEDGMIAAGGRIAIAAGRVENTAGIVAGLEANGNFNARGELAIRAAELVNSGEIVSSGTLRIDADTVANAGLSSADGYLGIDARALDNAGALFSGWNMDLHIGESLLNRADGVIFAYNDLLLAADDAGGRTGRISNDLGLIQTYQGDIGIFATAFDNLGEAELDYEIIYYDLGHGREVASPSAALGIDLGYDSGYTKHRSTARRRWVNEVLRRLSLQAPLLYGDNWEAISSNLSANFLAVETRLVDHSISTPAYLDSGRHLHLVVDDFLNRDSIVAAAGDMTFSIANDFVNQTTSATERVTDYRYYTRASHKRRRLSSEDKYTSEGDRSGYIAIDRSETVTSNAAIQAGGSIGGTIGGAAVNSGVLSGSYQSADGVDPERYRSAAIRLPQGDFGLFVRSTAPDSQYLVETNPRLTRFSQFAGSAYLLERLDFSPDATLKRLGDAFYESKLVRESIFAQAGRRYLDPSLRSDREQFQYLMDNALLAYEALELTPGVALEPEQINRLTRDIVWLETREVDGQRVLVPAVYLANGPRSQVRGGQVIAGDHTRLQVANLGNSGLIEAGGDLGIESAGAITNRGQMAAGGRLELTSGGSIENLSGVLEADTVRLDAQGGDIVNRRATQDYALSGPGFSFSTTLVDEAASIRGRGAVELQARDALVNEGSTIEGGQVAISADSVEIGATASHEDFLAGDDDNHVRESSSGHFASTISGDDIVILSAGGTRISGSRLHADGALEVVAGAIEVGAVDDSEYFARRDTLEGDFSETVSSRKRFRSHSVGSELSGATIVLVTEQGDIELTASDIEAETRLSMDSAGTIRIAAGRESSLDETYEHESGWFSGGSLYAETEDLEGRVAQTAVRGRIDAGSVDLRAGGDIELTGADVTLREGFTASAHDIVLRNATSEVTEYSKHTEISLGIDDLVSNLSEIDDLIETEDGRVTLQLGEARYAHVENTSTQTTVVATQIEAGEIVLDATRGEDGGILVEGSDLQAAGAIELHADGDVALRDAAETYRSESLTQTGTAEVRLTLQNEYDQAARAVKAVRQAERDLRHARNALDQYERELGTQEARLEELKRQLAAGEGFVEQADVDDFERRLERLRDDREFYETNIALAAVTLTSKTTALVKQGGKAAASSTTLGFNLGVELDIDALERQLEQYYRQSRASNLVAGSIAIEAGDSAQVRGSNLLAGENLDIAARDIEIRAGSNIASDDQREQHVNYSYRWDLLGESSSFEDKELGGSVGADGSRSRQNSTQQVNAQLIANNIRLNAGGDMSIEGAAIAAGEVLEIKTENLDLASVQDTAYSETESLGLSHSGAGGGLNAGHADSEQIQTLTTTLSGASVDIVVGDHTEITGAVVAATDNDGSDNGRLSLSTRTLAASSLNNTGNDTNRTLGLQGGEFSSLDYADDASHSSTKSLATLGSGDLRIGDLEGSDVRMLNTDLENSEVSIYDIDSHRGLAGELDTRLLSEQGRDQIAEDWLKTGMIGNTIELIVTTEKVGIEDFFGETDKYHKTYQAIKQEIARDPLLAAALQNPDLSSGEKEYMLDQLTGAVMRRLGYSVYRNNIVATDEFGRDGVPMTGFYSLQTGEAYLNDLRIDDTETLLTAAGHEAIRAIDQQNDENFNENRADRSVYAENYGQHFATFADHALDISGYESGLALTNNHVDIDSEAVRENNRIFSSLDKNLGDNYLAHADKLLLVNVTEALWDCHDNGGCSAQQLHEMQMQAAELVRLDEGNDNRLESACKSASSDACRVEVRKLREALHSYLNLPSRATPFRDGTAGEYIDVGTKFGTYSSEAMSDNAKRAIASMPVDALTGAIDLSTIVLKASAGDEIAGEQLALIGQGIVSFIKSPVDTIEQNIKAQLEEADRLEAKGYINEAQEIRSRVIIEGAFAVTGAAGGTINIARIGLGSPDLPNTHATRNDFEEQNQNLSESAGYREIVGVGADGSQSALPKGYQYGFDENGDVVIRGPRDGIYRATDYYDQYGNPLYENSGKLYSMDGIRQFVKKREVSRNQASIFDSLAIEGQARQVLMLETDQGFHISGFEDEMKYPEGTLGNPRPWNPENLPGVPDGGFTFLTDRKVFTDVLGDLPEIGGEIRVTTKQLRELETDLGLPPKSLGEGSIIRQFQGVRNQAPASPLEGNEFFRGPGFHLPSGGPEIIVSPAQSRSDNLNLIKSWKIEVTD